MQTVRECYERSFLRLVSCEVPRTTDDETKFNAMIDDIKQQDTHDHELISNALRELIGVCTSGARREEYLNFPGMDKEAIDDWDFSRFLDKFYMSRTSLR